ncbi:unnamed protein product [Gongylonema pulchrum]|uniref:Uncharacterized protein n=1 Tax=Gongylonema pulchrum TaxID=637853 RepID=A0A3P7M9H4_9BILA|nr:unnamed protein product [Gongylonema pulchrum]
MMKRQISDSLGTICMLLAAIIRGAAGATCGSSGIPFRLEVLPSGQLVLGCASPSCFGAEQGGRSVMHDSKFEECFIYLSFGQSVLESRVIGLFGLPGRSCASFSCTEPHTCNQHTPLALGCVFHLFMQVSSRNGSLNHVANRKFSHEAEEGDDGFFREGDMQKPKSRYQSAPAELADCPQTFSLGSCPASDSWVGGILRDEDGKFV